MESIENKIVLGTEKISNKVILHTAPHHDDILLGYHPYAVSLLADNQNHFLYLTSGSNGVYDEYLLGLMGSISDQMVQEIFASFKRKQNQFLVYQAFVDSFVAAYKQGDADGLTDARKKIAIYHCLMIFNPVDQVDALALLQRLCQVLKKEIHADSVFTHNITRLKGAIRKSESDCKWRIYGVDLANITHADAKFYTDASQQAFADDVAVLTEYLQAIKPDIIFMAIDPAGIGPLMHYKTVQVLTQALIAAKMEHVTIYGYRNVWSSFTLEQASIMMPVTMHDLATLQTIFTTCFASQADRRLLVEGKQLSFAQTIMWQASQQWQQVVQTLGASDDSCYAGAIFLRQITVDELQKW